MDKEQRAKELVEKDFQALCEWALDKILLLAKSRYAFYGSLNEDESLLTIYSWSREVMRDCQIQDKPIEYPISQAGLWGEAVRKRKALIINDYQADHPGKKGFPKGHIQLSRILVVPIFNRHHIVSLGAVANKPTDYTEEDAQNIEAFLTSVHLLIEHRKTEEKLKRANRALRTLGECNQALVRSSDEFKLLQKVCRILVEIGGYCFAWVGYPQHDEEKTVRSVAQWGLEENYLDNVKISWADNKYGQGPTGMALRTKKQSVCRNILSDPQYTPWQSEATKRGYASSIALPLIASNQTLGVLNIYARESDAFDQEEISLLEKLADDLAYGIIALRTHAQREQAEKDLRNTLKELKRERKRIEELVKKVIEAQERERLYLASEIHDDLLQSLVAVKYFLQMLDVMPLDEKRQQMKDKIFEALNSSLEKGRNLLRDVEPIREPEIGLIQAIKKSIDLRLSASNIKVKFSHPEKLPALEPTFKTNILRIVQESLMNVRKHSQATEVSINIFVSKDKLHVEIKDNGVGFDLKKASKKSSRQFGLLSMQERAKLIHGKLTIKSTPGKGTSIKGAFPLPVNM
jgi:signal transduction histidine kinase